MSGDDPGASRDRGHPARPAQAATGGQAAALNTPGDNSGDQARRGLVKTWDGSNGAGGTPAVSKGSGLWPPPGSVVALATPVLRDNPERWWTAGELADATGKHPGTIARVLDSAINLVESELLDPYRPRSDQNPRRYRILKHRLVA